MLARCLLALALAGGLAPVGAQVSPRTPYDSAVRIIRERSLHREGADWSSILMRYDTAMQAARDAAERGEALRQVLVALDDVHSSAVIEGRSLAHWRGVDSATAAEVGPLLARARAEVGTTTTASLDGGIAYLRLPGMMPLDQRAIDSLATALREAICALGQPRPTGWIIDLRLNLGGNIYPMLTGLGELLGDGALLSTVRPGGVPGFRWTIEAGTLVLGGYRTSTAAPRCPGVRIGAPIAVLIGPVTMSSGQATAIAIAGDSLARLFGTRSAEGYATSNQSHPLPGGGVLNLSEEWFVDRSGRRIPGVVEPDEAVPGRPDFDELTRDPAVGAAIRWLRDHSLRLTPSTDS